MVDFTGDCAFCLQQSIGSYVGCTEWPETEFPSSDCITSISNNNIIGVWTNFSSVGFGDQGLDDPLVFSKGFSMMQDLASSVPYQPLMYQAAEIDVGVNGERYGLAQCGRDLSKLDCKNCLEDRLQTSKAYVENRTGWEILGSSCSMWYSNVSDASKRQQANVTAPTPSTLPSAGDQLPRVATSSSGAQRCHRGIEIGTSLGISTFSIFLLSTQIFQWPVVNLFSARS